MTKAQGAVEYMDALEKKAEKGLESFSKKGDIDSVKLSLDGFVDDLLGEDEEVVKKDKSKGNSLRWLIIAAAILGLAFVGYLGFKDGSQLEKTETPQAMYAQYFEVLPDATSANERGTKEVSEIVEDGDLGMQLYNKGEFKGAASILKMQDSANFLVYGAIAEMKNNNIKSALSLLLQAQRKDVNNRYADIVDWYLSLAYLKDGETEKAKKSLSAIASGNHYKKEDAKSILESL